jgi:hypothetical protein
LSFTGKYWVLTKPIVLSSIFMQKEGRALLYTIEVSFMQIPNWHQSVIYASTISCCFLFDVAPMLAMPSVTASATNNSTNLPIAGATATTEIRQVADLTASTAATNGLKLVINQNSLTKTDGITPIPVQFLAIADGSEPPAGSAFTTAATMDYEYVTNAASTTNLDLYIKYTTGQSQDPGNYTAILQLSVTDNP